MVLNDESEFEDEVDECVKCGKAGSPVSRLWVVCHRCGSNMHRACVDLDLADFSADEIKELQLECGLCC